MQTDPEPAARAGATGGAPYLAAVLVTDVWPTIEPVVAALAAQTLRAELELVFATPDPQAFRAQAGAALEPFARSEVVAAELDSLHAARAVAIRRVTARYVFIGETHTYPAPGWIEAVLDGHRNWDVVVPAFENANPGDPLSWGAFLSDYGWWSEGLPGDELRHWPVTNTSYPRSFLLGLGDELPACLVSGDRMPREVLSRGLRAGFVGEARIAHANVAEPRAWIRERYLSGLVVGGYRGGHWSAARRIVYAGGGPLIAPLLMKRTWGAIPRARRRTRLPRGSLLAWGIGTVIKAYGEAVGYLKGVAVTDRDLMNEYEIHKLRYTRG